VLGALGTDTGGSIRIPAAYCGITGLKPTYGRVPVTGCVPLAFTIDTVGPMARSVRDCATLLAAIAGPTAADGAIDGRFDEPVPACAAALTGDLRGVRIGVDRLSRFSRDLEDPAIPGLLQGAIDVMVARGATVRDVTLPLYLETTFANQLITVSEALAFHRPDLRTRWGDYFQATRAILGAGVLYSAADYVQAQRVRGVAQRAVAGLFDDVDLIVTPTVSIGAPTFEYAATMLTGRDAGDLGPIHTVYWNAVGHPALSVPMGFTASGMPLGLQLAGRPFDEAAVLQAGEAFQRDTEWHLRQPHPRPTHERTIAEPSG
jgi:aspartyl-tRNA(Asn)/glutamyl-tRNA(Gln) amidotransferase subunit A